MKGAILFTDIKHSSFLWRQSPTSMYNALMFHNDFIERSIRGNKGKVIKNIGDSYMAYFDKLCDAVKAAMYIQSQPEIKVNKHSLRIRIGIACGKLYKKNIHIQGHDLIDFFGHTVNVAARLEANVSPVGGFAFAVVGSKNLPISVKKLIRGSDFSIHPIEFRKNCPHREISQPLLGNECRLESDLKGVGELQAFIARKNS